MYICEGKNPNTLEQVWYSPETMKAILLADMENQTPAGK